MSSYLEDSYLEDVFHPPEVPDGDHNGIFIELDFA